MHIYLVRHTELDNPEKIYPFQIDLGLSEEGREQAEKIADWFVEKKILNLSIYRSPLSRCRQTAEIIAAKTGSSIMVDRRLIETTCPNMQGKKWPEKEHWKVEEDDPTREPRSKILERVLESFNDKVIKGEDCVLVSHGDPLTVFYYYLINKEPPPVTFGILKTAPISLKKEILLRLRYWEMRLNRFKNLLLPH